MRNFESDMEQLERQAVETREHQEENESKMQMLQEAVERLEHDLAVSGLLSKQFEARAEDQKRIEKERERVEEELSRVREELESEKETISREKEILSDLAAFGEDVEEAMEFLEGRAAECEAIETKLEHIDALMEAGRNGGGTAGNRSAYNELFQYMSEHNYKKEDYEVYSRDPKWKELHEKAYPEYHGKSAQPSAYDQLFDYMTEHNYGRMDYPTYSRDPEWKKLHEKAYPEWHKKKQ